MSQKHNLNDWNKMTTTEKIEKTKDKRSVFPIGSALYQQWSNVISGLEKYYKGEEVKNESEI
jgi:hypothetical protein